MGWVVNATPRLPYPRGSPDTRCIGGWVGARVGLDGCGKSRPTGIRSLDRSARSESLYRLRYPGPLGWRVSYINSVRCSYSNLYSTVTH